MNMTKSIKKVLTVSFILLLVAALLTPFLLLWRFFHPHTDNAFDELYHEMQYLQLGIGSDRLRADNGNTVELDYDVGQFMSALTPDPHMAMQISGKNLHFTFYDFIGDGLGTELKDYNCVDYRYEPDTNTLYGEGPQSRLTQDFFALYFGWCEKAGKPSKYTPDALGDYTYVWQESVFLQTKGKTT